MNTQQFTENDAKLFTFLEQQKSTLENLARSTAALPSLVQSLQRNNNLDGYSTCDTIIINNPISNTSQLSTYARLQLPRQIQFNELFTTSYVPDSFLYHEAMIEYDYSVFTKVHFTNLSYETLGVLPVFFGNSRNDALNNISLDIEAFEAGFPQSVLTNNASPTDNILAPNGGYKAVIYKNVVRCKMKYFALPKSFGGLGGWSGTLNAPNMLCIFQGYRR